MQQQSQLQLIEFKSHQEKQDEITKKSKNNQDEII